MLITNGCTDRTYLIANNVKFERNSLIFNIFSSTVMEDNKVSSDLEDDAELEALRLAALATLKNRNNKAIELEVSAISQIQPINSIGRPADTSSDKGPLKNHSSWRNNAQLAKKRGKGFPKPNQRSNLIVITPVGADKEKPERKPDSRSVPQLLLPQHKWCQQVNDDSSSPRTDRHTGPSRFNRHDSGSESSDSDYDESDDSYSNDTVLQDEHSQLSAAETNEENLQNGLNSERRMSFQDFESVNVSDNAGNSESTPVYSYFKTDNLQNESRTLEDSRNNTGSLLHQNSNISDSGDCNGNNSSHQLSSKNEKDLSGSSLVHKNGEYSTLTALPCQRKTKHTPIKFDSGDSKGSDRKDKPVFKDLRNIDKDSDLSDNTKSASLSKNDLRYELKKKKETSVQLVSPKKYNSDAEHRPNKRNRSREGSRDRKSFKLSPSYSPKYRGRCKRRHSRSSSSSSSSRSSSPVVNRSVSSVVQPVQSKVVVTDTQNNVKLSINRKSNLSSLGNELYSVKKPRSIEIKLNPRPNFQISVIGKDSQNNATEAKKRGPVHMRLGTLPGKRIIQMPKAVEAAFVGTSSDDDNVNNKCKKSNITISNELSGKIVSRYSEKELNQRSDVPKAERGKFFR